MNDLRNGVLANLRLLSRFYPFSTEVEFFVGEDIPSIDENILCHIVYYLISLISIEKRTEFLMDCWPLKCSKTRSQFRIGVKKFMKWIDTEWPEAQLRLQLSLFTGLSSLYMQKIYKFLLKLSLFSLKFHMRKDFPETCMTIPELYYVQCSPYEKLFQFQYKAKLKRHSFSKKKLKLNEELKNKRNMLRKLESDHAALDTALKQNDILVNIVDNCPDKFRSKLLCTESWMLAIAEWTIDLDNLADNNELKRRTFENLYPQLDELWEIIDAYNKDDSNMLDAEEILPFYYKKIFKTSDTNKLHLFNNNKLSLPNVIKINKITSEKILCFFQTFPPLSVFESQLEAQKMLNDLESLEKFCIDRYAELSRMENELFNKCEVLAQYVKDEDDTNDCRRLSKFFESPLLTLPVEDQGSPQFSSPGLSGAQLLEGIKQKIKRTELKDTCAPMENGTPVSRRISQIPKLCSKNTAIKGLSRNLKCSSKNDKKQTWEAPMLSIVKNNISYPQECVLSSTLCSESSRKKNLLDPVQNDSLSPILKSGISDGSPETLLSSDDSDDYCGPSSIVPYNRPDPSEEILITKPRQSIDRIIAKYRILRKKLDEEKL